MERQSVIFPASDIKALLEGRKTQMRVRLKHEKRFDGPDEFSLTKDGVIDTYGRYLACPLGGVGDVLRVKEPFKAVGIMYTSDGARVAETRTRPAKAMPEWMSRIKLRITDIGVEWLHDITKDDAIAEGSTPENFAKKWDDFCKSYERWELNPMVWVIEFEVMV